MRNTQHVIREMAIPVNPYVAGNPVGDSPAFVGRADVLREAGRVLRRSQDNAIVLYGQRRIGKTSILQHLAAQLPGEGPYRPVYFDLQDKADWPLGRVLGDLALTIAHALGQPDPDLGSNLEAIFRGEWLPDILDDLPDDCSLVLLFDEFDVLADPQGEQAAKAFFPYLRGLLASDPGRLQFVFVIGRNVDDLDSIALSLFKDTPYQHVSLLSREDTADLVRLSQANGTLRWPDEGVERVWQLTHGHPFLTQQLCSHVWERAYDEYKVRRTSEVRRTLPAISPQDVDTAVPDALEASRNALEWLWDGLPPAERVVASALAEAGPGPITQEGLESLLHESGVRVIIRELQNAPQLLQGWDLIEPANGGYHFRVEMLRRWLVDHKPLRRVQEELDRIEPVADSLYRAALGLYRWISLGLALAWVLTGWLGEKADCTGLVVALDGAGGGAGAVTLGVVGNMALIVVGIATSVALLSMAGGIGEFVMGVVAFVVAFNQGQSTAIVGEPRSGKTSLLLYLSAL